MVSEEVLLGLAEGLAAGSAAGRARAARSADALRADISRLRLARRLILRAARGNDDPLRRIAAEIAGVINDAEYSLSRLEEAITWARRAH